MKILLPKWIKICILSTKTQGKIGLGDVIMNENSGIECQLLCYYISSLIQTIFFNLSWYFIIFKISVVFKESPISTMMCTSPLHHCLWYLNIYD